MLFPLGRTTPTLRKFMSEKKADTYVCVHVPVRKHQKWIGFIAHPLRTGTAAVLPTDAA